MPRAVHAKHLKKLIKIIFGVNLFKLLYCLA